MAGYWGRPDLTAQRMIAADDGGRPWYKTGDIVVEAAGGNFIYMGSGDRMVQRSGYQIALDEIETRLYEHPGVKEVAVVARSRDDGMLIHAHISTHDGRALSSLQLKTFCSQSLPTYMVPDSFFFHERLPRTSTAKVDYQGL